MLYETASADDTRSLGRALGQMLSAGDVVLLYGDLGAGKSVLARAIAEGLGIYEPMPSPTFTLMQPYTSGRIPLYHFDLYRLDDPDEFYQAGLSDYVGGDGVAVVEWPECGDLTLEKGLSIQIAYAGEEKRAITITPAALPEELLRQALKPWEVA